MLNIKYHYLRCAISVQQESIVSSCTTTNYTDYYIDTTHTKPCSLLARSYFGYGVLGSKVMCRTQATLSLHGVRVAHVKFPFARAQPDHTYAQPSFAGAESLQSNPYSIRSKFVFPSTIPKSKTKWTMEITGLGLDGPLSIPYEALSGLETRPHASRCTHCLRDDESK